jgi:protocatechuate 3,4-dioxygenase beta subunit
LSFPFLYQVRSIAISCFKTADNVRGPFYRANAPFRRVQLCSPSEPGPPLTLHGRVTGGPNCVPLEAAVLDVWQANGRGLYSNMLGLGSLTNPKTFRLRGRFHTDGEGRYQIETILPGHYPWPFVRARHIHFLVTCPDYADLTTQIFFAGDRRLSLDPWVKSSLITQLSEQRDHSGTIRLVGSFDFVLERAERP